MSTIISLRNNFPAVARQLDKLGQATADKVMVRALNTTIKQGETEMARAISKEFRISIGEVKKRLAIKRATVKGGTRIYAVLEATRKSRGRSMNLIAFVVGGVPKRTKRGSARQLKVQVKRSGGRKEIPGAFVANQGRTVFIREGKGRLPIKALNTIDVTQMFNTKRINKAVVDIMLQRFSANFKREFDVVSKGYVR